MKLVSFQFKGTDDDSSLKGTHYGQELVSGKISIWYNKMEKKMPSIIVTNIYFDVDGGGK